VGAAAEAFFRASPGRLTSEQGALLAAVLPNPRRLRASSPSPYVLERARWIEAQMLELGGPAYLRSL
jgi:monofunctional biosynthetic peptidoglycan transglycosylase